MPAKHIVLIKVSVSVQVNNFLCALVWAEGSPMSREILFQGMSVMLSLEKTSISDSCLSKKTLLSCEGGIHPVC